MSAGQPKVRSGLIVTGRWFNMELTTDEIKANCEDLKVLGKGDFKALMKWRTALREEVRYTAHLG